jgi:hypothetical protein
MSIELMNHHNVHIEARFSRNSILPAMALTPLCYPPRGLSIAQQIPKTPAPGLDWDVLIS